MPFLGPTPTRLDSRLGLPRAIRACLFDLDGVLTQTAALHARAWKRAFDAFLRERSASTGAAFKEFDLERDYALYVDGKTREDGARSFLESRGIHLSEGADGDPPSAQTLRSLTRRKNDLLLAIIREEGVRAFPGSRRYLEAVRREGLRTAVVSSSRNCRDVLLGASLEGQLDARVDSLVAEKEHLRGKPAPDTFLAAARTLSTPPEQAAVFEDALAGIEAGRAGGFGFVVGVDRAGQAELLKRRGADVVVSDLAELLT